MSERAVRFGGRGAGWNGAIGRLRLATALCAVGGLAACSDGAARLGDGGITTASLGISNQDRIIRKVGADGGAPSAAAPVGAAPARIDRAPLVPAQPSVAVSDIEPGPASPTMSRVPATSRVTAKAAAERRDSFGQSGSAAPTPVIGANNVPVIPPAPKRTALSTVSTYPATGSVSSRATPERRRVVSTSTASGSKHTVAPGDTLYALARRYGVSVGALTAANDVRNNAIRVGQTLVIPGRGGTIAKAPPAAVAAAAVDRAETVAVTTASVPPAAKAPAVRRAEEPRAEPERTVAARKSENTTPVKGAFRWPVRGKVIAGFGQRTAAGRNDGIDIAVPVGTPVRAAAAGKVLYSGSEIEGFGNLILVRHADSWVSAYANSSSNLVKRGDKVSAGQTIAKSGKSGDASQPQLHFELRRNSQPVDPTKHLK